MKKILLGLGCLIIAGSSAISINQKMEAKAESTTNFKQDIVFNWDAEEFSGATGGGTNIYRYNANGQKEVATRLNLSSDYTYVGMSLSNIYDEPTGVAQGFSYAKHSSTTRLSGPVYTIGDEDYQYLSCTPENQSLTISYWVKNTNQESNRWVNDTASGTLCGNYEGIFSFRSKSITDGEIVGLDLGIGGLYYYSEKAETDTEIANISAHQFFTPSTTKRTTTATYRMENGNAKFMSEDWEMITYVFDVDNGFAVYKNDTKIASYAGSTLLIRNKGGNFTLDQYRNLLATMLNNSDTEFCIHRGFNRTNTYGQVYRNGIGIDDMNIFSRGLSDDEVKEFYNSYGTLNYMDQTTLKATYHDLVGNQCFTLRANKTHKSYGKDLTKTIGETEYKWYRWTEDENLQKEVNVDELKISSTPINVYLDWKNQTTFVTDGGIISANTFVNDYMHMEDYNTSLGWCNDSEHHYYETAKNAYNSLSDEGRFAFQNDETFADAKLRLDAWALANGDIFDFTSNQYTKSKMSSRAFASSLNVNNSSFFLVISVVSLGILSIFIYYAKRKKIIEK